MYNQIIYTSIAATEIDEATLSRILQTSVINNARDDLTGLLLYGNRTFMQALEGPEAAIQACIERIRRDHRHRDLDILVSTRIPEREFGQWSMGFHRINPQDAVALPNFTPFFEDGFNPQTLSSLPDGGLALMRALAEHTMV